MLTVTGRGMGQAWRASQFGSPGYIGTELTKKGMSRTDWYDDWLKFTPMGRVGEPREPRSSFWRRTPAAFLPAVILSSTADTLAGEALSRLLPGSGEHLNHHGAR